ncbi:DUF4190 domain-containing protein [Leucobacter ruminantium]|uniref:DUF4190 domain-containing protein n=1 Tax=Leucobacter ruminantium TaxID=1289170 RepID=A0A939LT45_9MICO|nr:DUF4190 domain-containing protein [Leucobacter ruminantium]MBO1804329.1 DUF4190 domain-containing protein [Leucobacter ruminantium]
MNDAPAPHQGTPAHPEVPPPGLPQSQPQPAPPQAPPVHYAPGGAAYTQPGGMPGAMYSPYAAQQAGVRPPMNKTAIWAFITSFFIGLLGLILGVVASKQIGNTGQRGIGFAMAGFYIGLVVMILQLTVGLILFLMLLFGTIASTTV